MDRREDRSKLFHRTMQALEGSLTAELVASDLDLEHGVFAMSAPEETLLAWATVSDRNYSRVPLRKMDNHPQHISGVAEIDLASRSVAARRDLTLGDVLASRTTIGELVQLLASRRFFFLLSGADLRQIVTVSDLNRLPVKVYLFTILSHLEGMLADLVLEEFPDEAWFELLSDLQQGKVRELFIAKRSVDIDTRLIDCTTLSQKFSIIAKRPALRARFGRVTRREFDRYTAPVKELRDRLAHGMDPIEEDGAEHLEQARDATMHGGSISRRKDPAWLAQVSATIHQMIGVAAEEPPLR